MLLFKRVTLIGWTVEGQSNFLVLLFIKNLRIIITNMIVYYTLNLLYFHAGLNVSSFNGLRNHQFIHVFHFV